MRDVHQRLESLDAEIKLLESQRCPKWQPRLTELLERRAELRRELNLDLEEMYGR